jgi:hypothetical protein
MLVERRLQRMQAAVGRPAMPSMVRTLPPSAWIANTVQDFTDLPSRSTVQAPQWWCRSRHAGQSG